MIATPRQALLIWFTSWLSLFNSIYASQLVQFDLSFLSFCVFITSLLYWSEPKYNWIRILDMSTVFLSLSYQMWKSYRVGYYPYLIQCTGIAIIYPASWVLYAYKKYWLSIYFHALMHICGNIANMKLYEYLFFRMK